MLHDVFICHASEDKNDFVRPLAESLRSRHIAVWYDEFSLDIGDSLREAIDKGLASTRFGIVVLSPNFFKKNWAKRELNGLVSREMSEDKKLVLPIWHNVGPNEVLHFSPPLADIVAASSASGIGAVVEDLVKKIRPEESPLIIARDFLIEKGLSPPVVTDEWWLDIVEQKQSELHYPDMNHDWRWIFPLPFEPGCTGSERGLNIAWTALQLDWARDGMEKNICQLTHPEKVHDFLAKWPGLLECSKENPAILALYAPQLTIPGYDQGLASIFDQLMTPSNRRSSEVFRYGNAHTVEGNEPLCGDLMAWRHPSFGNHTPGSLSYQFATAHTGMYFRSILTGFERLVWLLSTSSSWLPTDLRNILRKGFKERVHWWVSDLQLFEIFTSLTEKPRSRFSYTKAIVEELHNLCSDALFKLSIDDSPDRIKSLLIELDYLDGYYEESANRKERRKKLS